jgi:hypothetical protein
MSFSGSTMTSPRDLGDVHAPSAEDAVQRAFVVVHGDGAGVGFGDFELDDGPDHFVRELVSRVVLCVRLRHGFGAHVVLSSRGNARRQSPRLSSAGGALTFRSRCRW